METSRELEFNVGEEVDADQQPQYVFDHIFPLPGQQAFLVTSAGSSIACRPSLDLNTTIPAGSIVSPAFTPQNNNIFSVVTVSRTSSNDTVIVKLSPASGNGQIRRTTIDKVMPVLYRRGDSVYVHWIPRDSTAGLQRFHPYLVPVQAAWVGNWERMYQVYIDGQNVSMVASERMLSQDP